MRNDRNSAFASLRSLVRFILVYGLAVIALIWALPAAAVLVQDAYEGLGAVTRFTLIAVLVAVAGGWQLGQHRGQSSAGRLPLRRKRD